jgi:hypothetical protein
MSGMTWKPSTRRAGDRVYMGIGRLDSTAQPLEQAIRVQGLPDVPVMVVNVR